VKKKTTKKASSTPATYTYRDPFANPDDRMLDENSDKGRFALNPGCVLPSPAHGGK
jgi:hypothetical protein